MLDKRSEENLRGVHPDLQEVFKRVHVTFQHHMRMVERLPPAKYEIRCIEGLRDLERQKHLIETGASKLKNPNRGRHLTGHAIDFGVWIDESITYETKYYEAGARLFQIASDAVGVPITFLPWKYPGNGDYMHIQLTWSDYPIEDAPVKKVEQSKTIATAAGIGTVAVLNELVPAVTAVDVPWLAVVVVLAFVGFVIYERYKKIDEEGT